MDKDEIISMARAAGASVAYYEVHMVEGMKFPNYEALERFAAMVAKAEREACATTCEKLFFHNPFPEIGRGYAANCAAAVRARSQS